MATVGDNIKRIANQKNISMYRISKDGDVSNAYISELVNNKRKNPSADILRKIAKVLQVPVAELLEEGGMEFGTETN